MISSKMISKLIANRLLGAQIDCPAGLELPPGVVLRRSRWIPRLAGALARLGGPAAAVTLGRSVVLHPETRVTSALLEHELVHVRQWAGDPLFPLRYAMETLRHGYRNNRYEREAYDSSDPRSPCNPEAPWQPRNQ